MEDEEKPPNRPWLTIFVIITTFAGFTLKVIAFAYLFKGLCENVPDNKTYCKVDNDSLFDDDESNDKPEGEQYFGGYQFCVGIAIFTDLLVIIKISCKIYCCVKNVWIPRCAKIWECFHCCGNCWFVMAGFGDFLNILGIISVCMVVPFSDMIRYTVGFGIGFGNVLFGFLKVSKKTSL